MNEPRPCVVECEENKKIEGDDFGYQRVAVQKEALFHRFGDGRGYADDAQIPLTVAIVEMKETGEVKSVAPERIRFTDQ